MIAAHGTQTALDVLLEIHTGATISLKGAVMDSLETLAGRLGVRIRLTSKGRLESATIEVARIEDTTREWDEPPR
ncbi:hypothetical protein [Bradyrhizobium sp. 169]|uniref:hypothetical protein n=1 Tax=Bradyrhizobium sp. 169 TaxID=2782640 RepID=UPI001FFB972E|nr:hypothetical protein [Bradyrhizobium sp. 169]MCK1590580.1 hypothetical protein [Bradyrhizobium sp. 169]